MKKQEFTPADLGHLEDKALAIVDAFRKADDLGRSPEYRKFYLEKAEQIAHVLLRDFGHYFDKYQFNGIIPHGLDQLKD